MVSEPQYWELVWWVYNPEKATETKFYGGRCCGLSEFPCSPVCTRWVAAADWCPPLGCTGCQYTPLPLLGNCPVRFGHNGCPGPAVRYLKCTLCSLETLRLNRDILTSASSDWMPSQFGLCWNAAQSLLMITEAMTNSQKNSWVQFYYRFNFRQNDNEFCDKMSFSQILSALTLLPAEDFVFRISFKARFHISFISMYMEN